MDQSQIFCLISACMFCYFLLSFKRNIDRVRHLDLPKVYNPLCPSNLVWLLIQPIVLPLLHLSPFNLGLWIRYAKWGWEYEERYLTHAEMGDIWMQVTPSMNWVYVADADLINEIFHRREDFRRPLQLYAMLNIFGPNLGTVEGHDWQRHRKITGAAFNEQSYANVWRESLSQASGMLQWWMSHDSCLVRTTAKDVRTLSLNILANVGFQKSYAFDGDANDAGTHEALSFRQTLCFVLDNALLTMVVPSRLLQLPFMPRKWRRVGQAINALRYHMTTLYDEQKLKLLHNPQESPNLMSLMVRASEQAASEASANISVKSLHVSELKPKTTGLTMDEIFGNIFVYYFAGHDTTAAVFAYAIYLLSANPEVQDWIAEEIKHTFTGCENDEWHYEEHFPKLKRCLAVLYETIRLYDPIPGLPKWTGDSDRTIQYKGQNLVIPARTFVLPSLMAVHTHPRYWGADSLSWRPSRWITTTTTNTSTNGISETTSPNFDQESFLTPPKGTYFPWSDGQRNCPGKKFAQVEFVAVIARLFRHHRVAPERRPGEGEEQARERMMAVVNDGAVKMLLQMRHPERVGVRWTLKGE